MWGMLVEIFEVGSLSCWPQARGLLSSGSLDKECEHRLSLGYQAEWE